MREYKIKKIQENCLFTLVNENKQYEILFNFFSLKPKVNDIIILDEIILDEKSQYFSQPFCYELISEDNEILNRYIKENLKEYLILISNNKKFIFKRIYG